MMRRRRAAAIAAASCIAMEGVSYLAHRWIMHGPGMGWHRSHHQPPVGRVERNDLFPVCFSAVGVGLFAAGTRNARTEPLFWVGAGVTAYGAMYLAVHELVIHRRLPVPIPEVGYLRWLRRSHRIHHLFSGEPYGMLLPLVPRDLRQRAERTERDPLVRPDNLEPDQPAA